MTRPRNLLIGLGLLAVLAVVALLTGVGGLGGKDALPACDKQPSYEQAVAAVRSHPQQVAALQAVDPSVKVTAQQTCDSQRRGVVDVTYGSDEIKSKVQDALNKQDGFGAPVRLSKAG